MDLTTFTMLTQVCLSYSAVWSHVDFAATLKTGEIVSDYCKPVNVFTLYQSREMGKCTHDLVMRGLPLAFGYAFLLDISFPHTAIHWLAVLTSMFIGWFVSFGFRFCVGAVGFWTIETRGIGALCFSLSMLLMGFLVPIGFFPQWLADIAKHTPFPSMVQVPIDIYLGKVTGQAIWEHLALQAGWAVVMTAFALGLLKLGERRLVTQGG